MAACESGHIEIARLLVEKGANLDTVAKYAGPLFVVEAQLRKRFCTAVGGSRTGIDRRALGFRVWLPGQLGPVCFSMRRGVCVEARSDVPAVGELD